MDRLYDKLISYAGKDFYPMHMPGHKRNPDLMKMPDPYLLDITEIDGFDNLHQPEGILKDLSCRISRLYGSGCAFVLVNGSTAGIMAAISAATSRGDKVLVARNAHKSVYNAIMLMGLLPVYYYPQLIDGSSIFGGISAAEIEELLINNPEITAVIITSPTYEGIVSDIKDIAEAAHRHKALLIVDEAHGAHFGFSGAFPETAVRLGADLVIQSLHKTLPSFTQTAVLHSNCDELNGKIRKYLSCYQSSSPSYILMAGIDRCISLLEDRGRQLFDSFYDRLRAFYKSVSDLVRLSLLDDDIIGKASVHGRDPSKLVVRINNADLNGHQLQDILRSRHYIEMEMAAIDYALGISTIADSSEGFMRMDKALHDIDNSCASADDGNNRISVNLNAVIKPERLLLPSEAAEHRAEIVSIDQAVGRVAATAISLFPPGIPLVVPGERLDADLIDFIRQMKNTGFTITGLAGSYNDGIEVLLY